MKFLLFVVALCIGQFAYANARCYYVNKFGTTTFPDLRTSQLEEKILASRFVQGGYRAHATSSPYEVGMGCAVHKNIEFEVTYFDGYKISVGSRYQGCATYKGTSHCTPTVRVRRDASLEGFKFGVTGILDVPMMDSFSLAAQVGGMRARADASIALTVEDRSYSFSKGMKQTIPFASLGVRYATRNNLSVAFERTYFAKEYYVDSLVFRVYF